MHVELRKQFRFESAHLLPNVPPEHKCRRLHGHSYRITVVCEGEVDPELGWLVDFDEIVRKFEPIRLQLDHYFLNEIKGLENPTAENLAKWIWDRLKPTLDVLAEVIVHETCTSEAHYKGRT